MKSLIFLCLMSVSLLNGQNVQQKEINILPSSKLTISGDTNINQFLCAYSSALLPENVDMTYRVNSSEISFTNAVLLLKDSGFDCGNKAINKDFYDLLKAEKYPEIRLDLQKVKMDCPFTGNAYLTIYIAGNSKFYKVPIKVQQDQNLNFRGTLKLNISDFDLKPPHKMFGLIVVKDDIEINFNITIKNNVTWATN